MTPITLQAHFDGQQILLNEPFDLQPGTQLIVTVVQSPNAEPEAWYALSAQNLATAYSDDEPDYDSTLIKEQDPVYEGLPSASESFRQGWHDAMTGNTIPIAQLWDGIDIEQPNDRLLNVNIPVIVNISKQVGCVINASYPCPNSKTQTSHSPHPAPS
jgi:hypothetical protein